MAPTNVKQLSRLRLLVCLDGSARDTAVLDEVGRLATGASLEVTLLHTSHRASVIVTRAMITGGLGMAGRLLINTASELRSGHAIGLPP